MMSECTLLSHAISPPPRHILHDDVLPDGTAVKKHWRVMYAPYAMGRMTRIWGPDARQFRPERWLTPDGQVRLESPFKFPAFNAGPRLCLGRDLAYLQMKSVVGSVLRRFRLRLVPGHPVEYCMSLTLFMKHGLQMTVHPRKRGGQSGADGREGADDWEGAPGKAVGHYGEGVGIEKMLRSESFAFDVPHGK